MSRCTAPVNGHRTASGAASCPACGSRGYRSYNSYPSYSSSYSSYGNNSGSRNSEGSSRTSKARWSKTGSTILYTPAEIRTLTPIRENVEKRSSLPDLRDVFLCHAWEDRKGAAKDRLFLPILPIAKSSGFNPVITLLD